MFEVNLRSFVTFPCRISQIFGSFCNNSYLCGRKLRERAAPRQFERARLHSVCIILATSKYDRTMNIRLEQPKDYREVENLTREAFWNVYRPGCTEHYVLNQYRTNPDFIPELDFVMEEGDKIIGHVMFSKAEITLDDGTVFPSWTFGPISIHPDYKRKGYGLKLLKYALKKAKEMGIGLLQMEGNIEFYKHAGFDLASKMKIHYHAEPRDAEVPYFLAQELIPGYWGNCEGTYCPPNGYFVADENPEAFEAYEATFPKKEKAMYFIYQMSLFLTDEKAN